MLLLLLLLLLLLAGGGCRGVIRGSGVATAGGVVPLGRVVQQVVQVPAFQMPRQGLTKVELPVLAVREEGGHE